MKIIIFFEKTREEKSSAPVETVAFFLRKNKEDLICFGMTQHIF
jgi:hypothetical protein